MQAKTSPKIESFLASPAGQRFIKFAGMLGSNADGERANASSMASKLLIEAGLTWAEVLGTPASQGGQQTRIRDLETRLRVVTDNLRISDQANKELRRKLADRGAQGAGDELVMKQKIARLERENAQMKAKLAETANPEFAGTGKPKRKKYASPDQEAMNKLVDEIEEMIELDSREAEFLDSMRKTKWKLSPKQYAWLARLAVSAGADFSYFGEVEF